MSRETSRPRDRVGRVAVLAYLVAFLTVPWLTRQLGGTWPSVEGWAWCLAAVVALPLVDAANKALRRRLG